MIKAWGLLVRRECWTLSLRGRILVLALAVTVAFAAVWETYPFLAVDRPIHGDLLIVEGWIPTYTLNQAADEFRRGHYRRLLIVRSFEVDEYDYEASRATLLKCGVPAGSLDTLYYPVVRKDRTYHSALAVKDWLAEHGMSRTSIDVATVGPHARRSWLMYQKALGDTATIGIVALDDAAYDSEHWWRTSEGVREVLGEAIAYAYARLFYAWN